MLVRSPPALEIIEIKSGFGSRKKFTGEIGRDGGKRNCNCKIWGFVQS